MTADSAGDEMKENIQVHFSCIKCQFIYSSTFQEDPKLIKTYSDCSFQVLFEIWNISIRTTHKNAQLLGVFFTIVKHLSIVSLIFLLLCSNFHCARIKFQLNSNSITF